MIKQVDSFIILCIFLLNTHVYSQQYQIKGKVIADSSNEPIKLVNAILTKNDSVYSSATTDSLGLFTVEAPKGDYKLKLIHWGEVLMDKELNISNSTDLGILKVQTSVQLNEMVIKSSLKKKYADRSVYSFDKETLENTRYAKDLLASLPGLKLDPLSQKINSLKGGKILFLVNGIEASDNQIKSIAPTHVNNVILYEIPPARWANRADMVVNIITRNPEVGYSFGVDALSAFTTGFLNGSSYVNYTKGNNDFGLEYNINYRDYNNRLSEKTYAYELNDKKYNIKSMGKDHFGYTEQDISFRYTRAVSQNYTFQTKFTISPFTSFSKGTGKSIFSIDQKDKNHESVENQNSKYANPTLDIYFSKNIGEKNELIFNIVGSHFKSHTSRFNHEWNITTNDNVFNDNMNLEATQTGFVGEIAHTLKLEKGQLNSGYRAENTAISNNLKNLLGKSQYDVKYFKQYFYTEYSAGWKDFNYRLSMGLTNINNKSATQTTNYWIPNPKVILSYALKKNHHLRLHSEYSTINPDGGELSPNVVQVAPNLVRSGNPYLKPSNNWYNRLNYTYYNKYFDIDVGAVYWHSENPILSLYTYNTTQNYYDLKSVNSKKSKEYAIDFMGKIKPFGNKLLSIQAFVGPVNQTVILPNNHEIKNKYWFNSFSISSEYKNFYIQYDFNIPNYYSLNGIFLSTKENRNNLFARYRHDNWSFSAGVYWLGMPSEYKTKTIEESLVNYSANTQILNNKNMFVLGFSYDFSSGKQLQMEKKLNNQSADAVTF